MKKFEDMTEEERKAIVQLALDLADLLKPYIDAHLVLAEAFAEFLQKALICPKCGADMSKQSKRGSKEVPCAECYLGGVLKKIDSGEIKL